MAKQHLTRELLMAAHRSDAPSGRLAELVIGHVYALCPRCREEFDTWHEEIKVKPEMAVDYSQALDNAVEKVRRRLPQLAAEDRGAVDRFGELMALPLARATKVVAADPARFRGTLLAKLLIEVCRELLPARPKDSYALALLAQTVLEHASPSPLTKALYALAVAYGASALRAQGQLRQASEVFGHARFLLEAAGAADQMTQAEFDWLEGALRRDQRRLSEAEWLLERAVRAYRLDHQTQWQARALLTLSMVHREKGDIARSIQTTKRALALLQPESEPRLYFYANHNLATWFCESGEYRAAQEYLTKAQQGHDSSPHPPTQLRLAWVEAKIARGLGEAEAAEEGFFSVREGFLEEGNAYDAALVSLELATMYLEQGRTGEVKALAEEMVPAFEAQEVHRETLAALILFRDAARTEAVTLGFLRELATYLERARLDPGQAFHQG